MRLTDRREDRGCWFCKPMVFGSFLRGNQTNWLPDAELHAGRPVCWECYFLLEDFLEWLRELAVPDYLVTSHGV